jgi:hypothetical protein
VFGFFTQDIDSLLHLLFHSNIVPHFALPVGKVFNACDLFIP